MLDDEIGYRLRAAIVSYLLRRVGVDRTLKELRQHPLPKGWTKLASELAKREMDALDKARQK